MKRSDDYLNEFDLEDYGFPSLACDTGIEIDSSITRNEEMLSLIGNPSQKLSKILKNKIIELEKIRNHKKLCIEGGHDMVFLKEILDLHEFNTKNTPYKIRYDLETLSELRDELVPIYLRISENLNSFKELPKNRQEILRDFSITLSKELMKYTSASLRRLAD